MHVCHCMTTCTLLPLDQLLLLLLLT
jgi:hypothetical protein